MNKKLTWLIVIVLIVVVAMVLSIRKNLSWKTYTDSMFKVELMIPESWTSISGRDEVGSTFFKLMPDKKAADYIQFAFKGEARCIPTTEVTISDNKAYDVGWRHDPKNGEVRIICMKDRPYSIRLVATNDQMKDTENKIIDSIKFSSSTEQSTTENLTKTYIDQTFGFSIAYPESSSVTFDKDGTINITSSTSPFIIKKTNGYGYDSNGKFGITKITFVDGDWVGQVSDERTGDLTATAKVKPDYLTDLGLPVFNGSTRSHGWGRFAYIIALNHTRFLTVEGPDNNTEGPTYSENNDPTLKMVKTIKSF